MDVVGGLALGEEPEVGVIEVGGERGTGKPGGEASEEDRLNDWAGVVPCGIRNAIRTWGGGASERENAV